jgi:hypothetical protein
MSDAYATRRFHEALRAFQALESPLRESLGRGVDARKIDAVLIDLDAALPGLDGEERGRALIFKGYVLQWRHIVESSSLSIFDAIDAPPDPRIEQALEAVRQGRALLQDPDDVARADELTRRLEAERR